MQVLVRFVWLLLASLPLHAADLLPIHAELGKVWPQNRTINLVFHGHSVPSGYHKTPRVKPFESYPHLFRVLLMNRYPSAVVNVITTSVGGESSIAGARRFAGDVLPHKPDLVFIDYALNDRRENLAAVENAWRSMIASARAAGVAVMLITPTGATDADLSAVGTPLAERAALIRKLVAEEDVLLADVSAAWLAALKGGTPQQKFLSQGNHPNAACHRIAADCLWATFSSAIVPNAR